MSVRDVVSKFQPETFSPSLCCWLKNIYTGFFGKNSNPRLFHLDVFFPRGVAFLFLFLLVPGTKTKPISLLKGWKRRFPTIHLSTYLVSNQTKTKK